MDRKEAKAIYERGEEAVIEKLIEMDAHLTVLEKRITELTTNPSKPRSFDGSKSSGKPNVTDHRVKLLKLLNKNFYRFLLFSASS